jgi:hypothetical protein
MYRTKNPQGLETVNQQMTVEIPGIPVWSNLGQQEDGNAAQ